MKPVTRYQANDGTVWESPEQALQRDELIDKCNTVAGKIGLRPRPESIAFFDGGGYIQQPPGSRSQLLSALRELDANRDSVGPIGALLSRAWCMDERDREWGQAFYALHPDKGSQTEFAA